MPDFKATFQTDKPMTVDFGDTNVIGDEILIPGPQGPQGPPGEPGKDGYTPIKGVDYFTPDEVQEIAEQAAEMADYELPIATPSKLGGVKPDVKSEDMTQPVGVDTAGGLWTVPAGEWRLIRRIVLEDDVSRVDHIDTDEDGNPFDLKSIVFYSPNISSSVNTTSDMHGRFYVGKRGATTGTNMDLIDYPGNAILFEIGFSKDTTPEKKYPFAAMVAIQGGILEVKTSNGTGSLRQHKFYAAKSGNIQRFGITVNNSNNFVYAAGTIFEAWGIDAR